MHMCIDDARQDILSSGVDGLLVRWQGLWIKNARYAAAANAHSAVLDHDSWPDDISLDDEI
jgi:hypothetical protein